MKLSEFETEVLQVFWQSDASSAPEIHKVIAKSKDVTYSTVKTIIDRLEKKGAIKRIEHQGRTIIYAAASSADNMRKPLLDNFINVNHFQCTGFCNIWGCDSNFVWF